MSDENSRWDEIRRIHIESKRAYRILGGLVLVGLGVWLGANLFAGDSGYATNLYTELISIGITVFIIDILNSRRNEQLREEISKKQLVREVKSPDNATARNAVHELRDQGWLTGDDGLLRGENLDHANLENAYLSFARLDGAYLFGANLSGETTLEGANLAFANLTAANLSSAFIGRADFTNTNLWNADLRDAFLASTNMRGANLVGADFADASMAMRVTDTAPLVSPLILPDGNEWSPETDMEMFTNPAHPNFWRSKDPNSPAHPDFKKNRTLLEPLGNESET